MLSQYLKEMRPRTFLCAVGNLGWVDIEDSLAFKTQLGGIELIERRQRPINVQQNTFSYF